MKPFLALAFLLLLIPLSTAEVIFSQPSTIYSAGDEISMSVTVKPISTATDFLTIDLVCNSERVQIYRNPLTIVGGQSKEIQITSLLKPAIIGGLEGSCSLEGVFGDEKGESPTFELSRAVTTEVTLLTLVYNPGELLSVNGTAVRANGKTLDGFVEARLMPGDITLSGIVKEGKFSLRFTLPENYPPGDHTLEVRAYEKDELGRVMNEGTITKNFIVKTVLRRIEIIIPDTNVDPTHDVEYSFAAYDQNGTLLDRDVKYRLYGPLPKEKLQLEKLTKTGVTERYSLLSNAPKDYWKIEAFVGNMSTTRTFYVNDYELVDFVVTDQTLLIHNAGNIPYYHSLKVLMSNESSLTTELIPDFNLGLNETKEFTFEGPAGTYDVYVESNQTRLYTSTVTIPEDEKGIWGILFNPTGRVVGIEQKKNSSIFSKSFLWIALLALMGLTLVTNIVVRKKIIPFGTKKTTVKVSSPVTVAGRKEVASVLALRMKYLPSVQDVVDETLASMLKSGAKIYNDDDYKIVVFSPLLTKSANNDMSALRTAREIQRSFEAHNKRGKDKIDFGIGVNKGEVISEIKQGAHKITSVGNLIPTTKRLASASQADVLVSPELYKTMASAVKGEKHPSLNAYRLTQLFDRSDHSSFIASFLSRQQRDKK